MTTQKISVELLKKEMEIVEGQTEQTEQTEQTGKKLRLHAGMFVLATEIADKQPPKVFLVDFIDTEKNIVGYNSYYTKKTGEKKLKYKDGELKYKEIFPYSTLSKPTVTDFEKIPKYYKPNFEKKYIEMYTEGKSGFIQNFVLTFHTKNPLLK